MNKFIPPMFLWIICLVFQANTISAQQVDRCAEFDIELSSIGIFCDQSRGQIEVDIIGGISGEYLVEWDNLGNTIWEERNTFFPFYTIVDLPPSTYRVKVTDRRTGCFVMKSISLIKGELPEDLVLTGNAVACNGMGTISITIPRDKPPFFISLNGPVKANYIANSRNFRIYNLPAGEYEIGFEEDGCVATTTTVVSEGENLPKVSVKALEGACAISTGAVVVEPSGGIVSGDYTLSWDGPTKGSINIAGTTEVTGLITGSYKFTLTDDNGCKALSMVDIDRSGMSIDLATTQSKCNQNGSIKVDISSGAAPYTVSWKGGGSEGSREVSGNSTTFSLPRGTYIIEVNDANGCSTYSNTAIIDVPTDLYCSISTKATTCKDDNGSMKVFISGGKKPYTLSYSGPVSRTVQANGTVYFHNLPAGVYTTFLQDAEGCFVSESSEVQIGSSQETNSSFAYSANGTAVFFFNNSTSGEYYWDFGDGGSSTKTSPSHNYANSGDYEVCLTTTDECGLSIQCQTLSIVAFKDLSGLIGQVGSKTELNTTSSAEGMRVAQNYPNPFVNQTEILFELPEALLTTITIHDNAGKVIQKHTAQYEKGSNLFTFNQNNLASGVYYYTISTGNASISKNMLIK